MHRPHPLSAKSTVEEIRDRFDQSVERFSNLDTGHLAAMDSRLILELIAVAAAAVNPDARRILDVGCGAGNYTLRLLELLPGVDVDLVDLSRPMLDRAEERLGGANAGTVRAFQADIRDLALEPASYDVILAAAVLHHLRADDEWRAVFSKLHAALRPGGALWISDLVEHDHPAVEALMHARYGDYLAGVNGAAYRDAVFAYTAKEDSPRSVLYQIDLLRAAGFTAVEILHKNSTFAAFGAVK